MSDGCDYLSGNPVHGPDDHDGEPERAEGASQAQNVLRLRGVLGDAAMETMMDALDRAVLRWIEEPDPKRAVDRVVEIAAELRRKEADARNRWATKDVEPFECGHVATDERAGEDR